MLTESFSLHVGQTGELGEARLVELESFLKNVFGPGFDPAAWVNCCGGTHILLYLNKNIVAHASLVFRHAKISGILHETMYLEAVAVNADQRKKQLGHSVMGIANFIIHESGRTGLLATSAVSFYRRLEWEEWIGPSFVFLGEIQTEARPRGKIMYLPAAGASIDPNCPIAIAYREGDIW